MNFPNEVSCSILIDPRDLGNVIGGKNSIDPRDLTVLPDGFHPLGYGFVADVMMEFASARRAAREDGIDASGGGPAPGAEDAPEGATVRATRPGDINISFPALAERAQAAALATARGASAATGNRL